MAEVFVLVSAVILFDTWHLFWKYPFSIIVAQLQCYLNHISLVMAPGWCNVISKLFILNQSAGIVNPKVLLCSYIFQYLILQFCWQH